MPDAELDRLYAELVVAREERDRLHEAIIKPRDELGRFIEETADEAELDALAVAEDEVRRIRQAIASARAEIVVDAAHAATVARSKGSQRTRDGRRLVMTSEPELLRDEAGVAVGVEVHVRLYVPDGEEIPIDGHRRFVNPPTEVATPEGQPNLEDPLAALWSILWDSVDVAPNPEGWEA